ncbi:hypothetical protein GCM10022207_79620 [Streptomyces lannensis]|uniref:Transposase n=1 Tax=Streptomyces lannensis TaxID=766498 RepID=A0ABP7LEM2_9ACTN
MAGCRLSAPRRRGFLSAAGDRLAEDVIEPVQQRRTDVVRETVRDQRQARWHTPETCHSGLRQEDGWRDYSDRLPVVTTRFGLLKEQGPT